MSINIRLELGSWSTKGIFALQQQYQRTPGPLIRVATRKFRDDEVIRLAKELPKIAAGHAPFKMSFSDPHIRTSMNGQQIISVRYRLDSEELKALQFDIFEQLNPSDRHSVAFDASELIKTTPRITVPVKTGINSMEEAQMMLEEVKQLDSGSLGKLHAIGLRLQWCQGRGFPSRKGDFIPFARIAGRVGL